MRFRRKLKRHLKLFLGMLSLLLIIIVNKNTETVKAAPEPFMEDGKIIITIESKAASSNIRYRTIGYTISTEKAPEAAYAKGRTGPIAPLSPNRKKYFLEFEKEELHRDEEKVITQYTLSEDRVKDTMKSIIDLDRISEDTILYFNVIFQTYKIVNDKEVILTPEITTWEGIVNDQAWANIDVFREYFNIEVPFKAGLQPNKLYYEVDGKITNSYTLDSLKIGENLYWDKRVKPTADINGMPCTLNGFYVKSKLTGQEIDRKMVDGNIKASDIINGSVKVLYGGLDVYMIYKPSNVKVTIDARDIDTDKDIKKGIYTGTIEPGEVFEQPIDKVITADGDTYSKTKHFYYYLKSNPAVMRVDKTENDDDPIKFTAFSNINPGDEIIVKAYFKKLSSDVIPVTVKAVNKDTEANLKTLTTGTVASGETYNYTVSEDPLSSGGKSYDFSGEWSWQYKKNTSTEPIITASGSGENISFKAPSSDDIKDGITVNVYYRLSDTLSDEINLRVIMVSKSGSLIEEISNEKVTAGQVISKQIQNSRSVKGITYQYMDKWDYAYTTSSDYYIKTGTANPAEFTVPANTKHGTVITLRLYYDAVQDALVPEAAPSIILSFDSPSASALINGDKYNQPYFFSKDGIATTESQYVTVRTREYLLGYRLVNRTGKIAFTVPVSMTYTLEYFSATPEEYGGPEPVTDTVTDTQYITVERAYSYWEIEKLEYYTPSTANVYNFSLPDGQANLSVNDSYLNIPSLNTRHSSRIEDHYVLPTQAKEGIHLTCSTIVTSDTSDRPAVEFEDLTSYAYEMTDELLVKNDYISFNGIIIMTDTFSEKITQKPNTGSMYHSNKMTHDKVLFKEGLVIDALKKNGVYPSSGSVTYARHPMSVNAYAEKKYYTMPVNDVTIHTPVICRPLVYSDNDKYVQLINPTEGAYHMVLDPDTTLNDFTVRISNTYPHSARLGYYERDFSKSFIDPENTSYIAKREGVIRNEMKLPFDVYIDINDDKDTSNDKFVKAGTWIILGRDTHRFYVPMWVKEGTYTAHFRTIAVNGTDRLDNTETTRNTNINNYIATDTKTFQISGRMYGLTLYDISDEGRWGDVFRIKDSTYFKLFEGAQDGTKRTKYHEDYAYYYTVGIKNQYGYQVGRENRFTFPLLNGSHPKYKNVGVIKTGYAFRFMIDTIGEMYSSSCKIRITPSFYHVDANGNNRQPVDIYYDEEIYDKQYYLVKVGEGIDLANIQQGLVGNPYSKIPEAELRHTANVMDTTYSKIKYQFGEMYSYSDIRLTSQFRTFIGLDYASHIAGMPSFAEVREQRKETELSLSKYMQRWYGTYKLPTDIHVVPKGYDVKGHLRKHGIDYHEDFWLKDGYIIVNFNIESCDKNGNRHLSYTNGYNYINNGHCSMWVMEGGAVGKTDNTGAAFRLYAGDVVFYYTSKKHSDDYYGRVW